MQVSHAERVQARVCSEGDLSCNDKHGGCGGSYRLNEDVESQHNHVLRPPLVGCVLYLLQIRVVERVDSHRCNVDDETEICVVVAHKLVCGDACLQLGLLRCFIHHIDDHELNDANNQEN